MRLRIAGAQLPVTDDVAQNLAAIRRGIEYAARTGADILLTPEGSLSGYNHAFEPSEVEAALTGVTAAARSAGVGLALGTCFAEADGRRYNQVRFYDRTGAFLGFHAKTLLCGSWTAPPKGEIEHYAAAPLRTFDFHGLAIGGLICNDLWANPACTPMPDPHLTQQLAQRGAKVILHAVNGGRDGGPDGELYWQFHEANLRIRARAGKVWIATVDNCHPACWPCSAPSGVVSPRGEWCVQAARQGEQFYVCDVEA